MFTKPKIKKILKQYNLYPNKRLGQNFLIDQKVVKKMIGATQIKKDNTILEIGPGLGSLTQALIKTGAKIIAIEKDKTLVKILKDRFQNIKNLKIIEGDIRYCFPNRLYHSRPRVKSGAGLNQESCCHSRLDRESTKRDILDALDYRAKPDNDNLCKIVPTVRKVIANLPYYLTAPVIRQFLELKNPPKLMVFLIQKEVAQRICARPPKMNLLAVSIQVYAQPKIISYVSKKSFWPQPEVDGAIIRIEPIPRRRLKPATPVETYSYASLQSKKHFFRIVKAGFAHPRKQLANNLAKALKIKKTKIQKILKNLNLDPQTRAENLSIEQWIKITHRLEACL